MAWYQKIVNSFRKKDATMTGGLELLSRLVTPELSQTGQLEKYRKSLYVFACINKIATKTASIDFQLFRILNSKGETKEILTHPALDLLYKVNPFQTKTEFIETTIINLKCTGEAFWFKARNNSGKVVELWNLRPDYITVVADPVNFIKCYRFTKSDGTTIDFDPDEIVMFKYPDPLSQHRGMSPLHPASKRIQTEGYATQWQSDFFLNSARPDGLIKNANQVLTPDQKNDIRESWMKRHGGLNNAYKVAILEGGLDYQLISLSQKEMDYIESLKFTRDDILVAFAVPKPIVAIVDDVNRANSETAMAIFLGETIKPEIARLVEKINEQLIYPDFGEEFYIDFPDPTPANRDLELREYETGIRNNYLLINEVRQKEGLVPIRGGWSFYMPLTNIPAGGLPTSEQGKAMTADLMKKIMEDSDRNGKIIADAHKPKLYDFKGRFMLKTKFELYETMEAATKGVLKNGKGGKKKKDFVSMITGEDLRVKYAAMINKGIDQKTEAIKPALANFFEEQKQRVLKNLTEVFSKKAMGVKMQISQIFHTAEEKKLSIDFIIPFIEEFLKESGQEALNIIAPQNDFTSSAEVQKRIRERARLFAESVNNTTLDGLDETLSAGIEAGEGITELSDRVSQVYEDFPAYRTELIARTEATAANNEGMLEGYRQSGVANAKEWINAGDDRVRVAHQNKPVGVGGEMVLLNKNFSNGLAYPQEPNCRCVLGPAFLE